MRRLPKILASALGFFGSFDPPDSHAKEVPEEVTLCQVFADASAFNHKLIRISGVVRRGFEEFTLNDSSCQNANVMWLELGGKRGSQVMYCCEDNNVQPERAAPLVIEGIETTLVEDDVLARFERFTKSQQAVGEARVVLVGRFFAGKRFVLPEGPRWAGYGHMGIGSLLVIQQVLIVSPR